MWHKAGNCSLTYSPNWFLITALSLMLIFALFLHFFLMLSEKRHFYTMLCLAVRMIASACLSGLLYVLPSIRLSWELLALFFHGLAFLFYSFPFGSALCPSCITLLFLLMLFKLSELPYAVLLISPIFFFWLHLLLIICCSCILIQPMSVFFLWNITHSLLLGSQL